MAQLPFLCFILLNASKTDPLIKATNLGKKNLSSPPAAPQELSFPTQALSVHCAWQAIDAIEQLRFGYIVDLGRKTNYTPHSINRKIAVDVIVKSCQMWWNAVKSCQISPIYLSFHHKLVAMTSLPHPTAKHEARQCTSLNLRVLLQNHLDRPWPATSWSWCKPMKCWKEMTGGSCVSLTCYDFGQKAESQDIIHHVTSYQINTVSHES